MVNSNYTSNTQLQSVSNHLIAARNIYKSFKSASACTEILMDLNFSLDTGETIAVIGTSGIGKSTLLNILGTLDKPDSGNLFFRGDDVFKFNNDKLARFRNEFVGFVFQFHHLLPEFTAIENTMLPALIKGFSKDSAKEAAEKILVKVGLRKRLFHKIGKLSGGEQQRVALARALILRPFVLLADEPTGNLDKKNSGQIHELLLELNKEFQMAMVVVTHNLELASCLSQRLTIIDGKLVKTS